MIKDIKTHCARFPEYYKLVQSIFSTLDESIYPAEIRYDLIRGFNYGHLNTIINRPNSICLVIEKDHQFVGFLFGWHDCGVFWLDWLGVLPVHRSMGLGKQLLEKLELICQTLQIHKIALNTIEKNQLAIQFYQRNNFQIEARFKKHWYKENWVYLSKEI